MWMPFFRSLFEPLTTAMSRVFQCADDYPFALQTAGVCCHQQHEDDKKSSGLMFTVQARSSRQEEKWNKREQFLLDTAQQLIEIEGLVNFNMDRLVKVSGISKGTVYNHFAGKEDCQAALCIRGWETVKDLFERALNFEGHPREVILAAHFAYRLHLQRYPVFSSTLMTARTPAFAEKVSQERASLMKELDDEIFNMLYRVVAKAKAEGALPEHLSETIVTFVNWSMSYGINMLGRTGFDGQTRQQFDGVNISLIGANIVLDGIGMTPLSKDWDYNATWQRIADEIFAHDLEVLPPK